MKKQQQKGFTLVELAIVLTIIGLLIGGILKGQQLIQNARVTSQIAQINAYKAATTTFTDTYSGLPGDLATATQRLPNCNAANNCFNGMGTGTIGVVAAAPIATVAPATSVGGENANYWIHLAQAGLIVGVAPAGALTFGGQLPFAKINPNAGLVVTDISAVGPPAFAGFYTTITMGNAAASMTGVGLGAGANAMTPNQAANIDRKMDDGQALTGSVIAFGVAADCTAGGTTSGYLESNSGQDCGLDLLIQ